jgi:hypothetical protein
MAVNAIVHDLMAEFHRDFAALPVMAGEALSRIRFGWFLGCVYIVAGRAGHGLRRAIALTSLQQADLVAVNVRVRHVGWRKLLVIIAQRLARNIGECRSEWGSLDTVMAFST